jgi:hypothetical protein
MTSPKVDDYYYEIYCLENKEHASAAPSSQARGTSPESSSLTTSESGSPPGLIRMDGHNMSEEETFELQHGYGYWDEEGELVLQASHPSSTSYDDSSSKSSVDYPDEEREYDVSDYDDYFDADAVRYSSDDDSDAGWKVDFRKRFVPKSDDEQNEWKMDFRNRFNHPKSDEDEGENESEGETSPGGFGTNRNRLHGWEYATASGMSDGESGDEEYAGPMLG